jgi:hypothetical protein
VLDIFSLSANEVGGEGRGEVARFRKSPLPDPLPALRCGAREMPCSTLANFFYRPTGMSALHCDLDG